MKKEIEKKVDSKSGDVVFNVPAHIKYYMTPITILVASIAITVIIILSR